MISFVAHVLFGRLESMPLPELECHYTLVWEMLQVMYSTRILRARRLLRCYQYLEILV